MTLSQQIKRSYHVALKDKKTGEAAHGAVLARNEREAMVFAKAKYQIHGGKYKVEGVHL